MQQKLQVTGCAMFRPCSILWTGFYSKTQPATFIESYFCESDDRPIHLSHANITWTFISKAVRFPNLLGNQVL